MNYVDMKSIKDVGNGEYEKEKRLVKLNFCKIGSEEDDHCNNAIATCLLCDACSMSARNKSLCLG